MITVYVEVFATLQDSPERRKHNCLNSYNGKFNARFRYICDLRFTSSKVKACKKCFKSLVDGCVPDNCTKCACWTMKASDKRLMFPAPEQYPGADKLSTKIVTFESVMRKVSTAHTSVVNSLLTAKSADAYLYYHGLNKESCEAIIELADNCRSLMWR